MEKQKLSKAFMIRNFLIIMLNMNLIIYLFIKTSLTRYTSNWFHLISFLFFS